VLLSSSLGGVARRGN